MNGVEKYSEATVSIFLSRGMRPAPTARCLRPTHGRSAGRPANT